MRPQPPQIRLRPPTAARTLAATALAAVLTVAAWSVAGRTAEAGAQGQCPSFGSLSPRGTATERFTILIRINKLTTVDAYANPDETTGGLRPRIKRQDVFVINTRFPGSTPAEWEQIADELEAEFPCNRVIALNGLRSNSSLPGYRAALAHRGELYSLLLDWEKADWNQARSDSPNAPRWELKFQRSLGRIAKRIHRLGKASLDAEPPGRRTGLVPTYYAHWDYGLIARSVDRRNSALRRGRRGVQIVQTQDACGGEADIGFSALVGKLLRQYRPRPIIRVKGKGKKRHKVKIKVPRRAPASNLGVEVSFSDTPDPSDPRPVARTAPGTASKCTGVGLRRGGGAFLYWASADSMRTLFANRRICLLRPPADGPGAC